MKPIVRNLFLLFGLVTIVWMLCTFDVDYGQLERHLVRAGLYFPAIVGVWVFVYAFNARAFQIIVNVVSSKRMSFKSAYKLTVSGFAFSYITPMGFGGGPYRMLELKSFIGVGQAMSSVVLYSMMHILSHFCLWATAAVLFVVVYFDKMTPGLWVAMGLFLVLLMIVVPVFRMCYKDGVIERLFKPLTHLPLIKRRTRPFYEKHREDMQGIDRGIAYLAEYPGAFFRSLLCEYVGRVINAFEYYFILLALGVNLTFVDAIIVLAFSSFIGNVLFFFPMQLGAREGSLSLIVKLLGLSLPGIGLLTSLYTRVRELIWIAIGVMIVKVGNKRLMVERREA